MNAGKYGRSSGVLKELLTLDPNNQEAKRLFATLQLRIGSLVTARTAFESMVQEAMERQDYWLAESLLREYLAAGPRCVPFLERLGKVLEIKGDPEGAVKEYAKAVEILIEDPDPDRPDLPQELYRKVLDLDPHSPAAFRLDSMLTRAQEASSAPAAAYQADQPPFLQEPSTLTSHEESSTVEIPPVDGSRAGPLTGGPPRLPWEADGHDVDMVPAQEEVAASSDPPASELFVPLSDRIGSSNESPSPPLVESESSLAQASSVMPLAHEDGDPLEVAPPDRPPIMDEASPSDRSNGPMETMVTDVPSMSTTGPEAVTEAAPSVATSGSSWQDVLSRLLSAAPVPVPQAEPALSGFAIQSAPSSEDGGGDSPSPTLEHATSTPDSAAGGLETGTLAAPMPWERVEDQPIVVPPKSEDTPLAAAEEMPPEIDAPSAASLVSPPMPWERVEDGPIVVPPGEDDNPPHPLDTQTPAQSAEHVSEPPSPVHEVNDHLIADILEHAELRDTVTVTAEQPVAVEDVARAESERQVHTPPTESEPEPIRSLLESAVMREPMSPDPTISRPELEEVSDSASSVSPIFPEPVESLVQAPADVPADIVSPATCDEAPTASAAVSPGPDPGAAIIDEMLHAPPPPPPHEEKLSFSFFPAVLRLVGVTSDKPVATDHEPEPELIAEGRPISDAEAEAALNPLCEPKHDAESESTVPREDLSRPSAPPAEASEVVAAGVAPVAPEAGSEIERAEKPAEVTGVSLTQGTALDATAIDEAEPSAHPGSIPTVESSPDAIPPEIETNQRAESVPLLTGQSGGAEVRETAEVSPRIEGEGPSASAAVETPRKKKKDRKKRGKQAAAPSPAPSPEPSPIPLSQSDATLGSVGEPAQPLPVAASTSQPWEPVAISAHPAAPAPLSPAKPMPPEPVQAATTMSMVVDHGRPATVPKPKRSFNAGSLFRRWWWRLTSFVQTCFATAHVLTVTVISLAALSVGAMVLGVGGLGVLWLGMEEKPNKAFQELEGTVPHTAGDVKRSSYALFLGMAAPDQKDPVQAGAELHADAGEEAQREACFGAGRSKTLEQGSPAAATLGGWYREANPSAAFIEQAGAIRGWAADSSTGLGRYRQWAGLPFEDGGYGRFNAANCAQVLYLHRLQVAEGFSQGLDQGIDRLEADLSQWRSVLRKARSLDVKMLAVAAITDDARVLSGLLAAPELDGKYLPRFAKAALPLDQVELSMRWPMQSEFLVQKKRIEQALSNEGNGDRPWYLTGVAAMPVPRQRVLNDYAEYYEALVRTAETSRESFTPPNLYARIHTPAQGVLDYVLNPINNVLGVETGPPWDSAVGRVREADALLRLVSLQAWLRKTAQEGAGDVKTRVAKAGQNFYDPFTGFPMLVNLGKGRLYSVGMNGKDEDAAPDSDVSVVIPAFGTGASAAPPSTPAAKK